MDVNFSRMYNVVFLVFSYYNVDIKAKLKVKLPIFKAHSIPIIPLISFLREKLQGRKSYWKKYLAFKVTGLEAEGSHSLDLRL